MSQGVYQSTQGSGQTNQNTVKSSLAYVAGSPMHELHVRVGLQQGRATRMQQRQPLTLPLYYPLVTVLEGKILWPSWGRP